MQKSLKTCFFYVEEFDEETTKLCVLQEEFAGVNENVNALCFAVSFLIFQRFVFRKRCIDHEFEVLCSRV